MTKHAPSLHDRLWADITGKILSGEWAPGARIPIEHDMTGAYGCSRATVNKVLTRLADAGLIERRRKAGSFVRRPHTQAAVLQIQDIGAEVSALGHRYGYRLVSRGERPLGAADGGRIDLPRRAPVLDLVCCHLADGRPFCCETRLISLDAVPAAAAEPFSDTPPGTWLIREVPWTSAEHVIRAVGADEPAARVLELGRGAPCLSVSRRTWSGGQPVTAVTLVYPADAHRLVARFEPSSEGR